MDLSNLRPAKGSTHSKKRIGRGYGSKGGHSSTRGTKGQKSVSGAKIGTYFEGGQMPLQRRLPKFGFKSPFRKEYHAVNLAALTNMVEAGRIDPANPVTPDVLVQAGLAKRRELIKILGTGDVSVALQVSAHGFSASARQKLEAAGGSATLIV